YPHLQLCVCYYNLQEYQKSYEHNEQARKVRPLDERVLFNKELLEKKLTI
ncbi:MAG TPA: glycosyl transferase, partial [Virgibacillus sp.]|nr:glycosyl transferase [Virgibacillus sp.]